MGHNKLGFQKNLKNKKDNSSQIMGLASIIICLSLWSCDNDNKLSGSSSKRMAFNSSGDGVPGTDPTTDPGVEPGVEPGVDPGVVPGVAPVIDPVADVEPKTVTDVDTDVIPKAPANDAVFEQSGVITLEASANSDIIFLLDTSGSMSGERLKLQEIINSFIDSLYGSFKDTEVQIAIVAEPFEYKGAHANRLHRFNREVDSHDALAVLMNIFDMENCGSKAILANSKLLSQCKKQWPMDYVLRADSNKEVIVITDDESNVSAAKFRTWTKDHPMIKGKLFMHSIVGQTKGKNAANAEKNLFACGIQNVGATYIDLSNDETSPGLNMNLCSEKWEPLLAQLDSTVKGRIEPLTVVLSQKPGEGEKIQVEIDGNVVTEGIEINREAASVTFSRRAKIDHQGKSFIVKIIPE